MDSRFRLACGSVYVRRPPGDDCTSVRLLKSAIGIMRGLNVRLSPICWLASLQEEASPT